MQFIFGDKGEVYLLDKSVLPLTEKKKERGKRALALGWKMDMQILTRFALGQTKGAAIDLSSTTDVFGAA